MVSPGSAAKLPAEMKARAKAIVARICAPFADLFCAWMIAYEWPPETVTVEHDLTRAARFKAATVTGQGFKGLMFAALKKLCTYDATTGRLPGTFPPQVQPAR
jgi:hypothetical protein